MGQSLSNSFPPFEFLEFGKTLEASLERAESTASNESQTELKPLMFANQLAKSAVGSVIGRAGSISLLEIDIDLQRRAAIHAAIIQNFSAVETTVLNAQYAASATLLRQAVEGIENLRGIRQNVFTDRATPRIKGLKHLGRLYGNLTGIAHLSDHGLVARAVGKHPPSIDVSFQSEIAKEFFAIHLQVVIGLAADIAEVFPFSDARILSPDETRACAGAMAVLVEQRLLEFSVKEPEN